MPRKARTDKVREGTVRLSETAYERVLESLFDRKLPVGAFISQAELSAIVGVPVAPLRDALRVLEVEGILKIHARSGIQIIRPGLELTTATFQFRSIIERAAIRVFAEQGDEAVMNALELRHSRLVRRLERDGIDAECLAELDRLERELHGAIVSSLHNPLVENTHLRMRNYLHLLRLDRKATVPVMLRTLREHLEILEACAMRSAALAEQALQAHFQAALQRNIGMI